jgi:hypothetical protein
MNVRDLSNDDDFLSHLLVEKLGTGQVPLLVHKMDPKRRLPKTDAVQLLSIVKRVSVRLRFGRVVLRLAGCGWARRLTPWELWDVCALADSGWNHGAVR